MAGMSTALSVLIYLAVQQTGRQAANDPQIQLAREATAALAAGQPLGSVSPATQIELASSISPFISTVADDGSVLASSGRLHGQLRTVPRGVLANVRATGEQSVTWQPEPGVRLATVVRKNPGASGGFIVVGRSLAETETRIDRIGSLLLFGWIATLIGLLALVGFSEALEAKPV